MEIDVTGLIEKILSQTINFLTNSCESFFFLAKYGPKGARLLLCRYRTSGIEQIGPNTLLFLAVLPSQVILDRLFEVGSGQFLSRSDPGILENFLAGLETGSLSDYVAFPALTAIIFCIVFDALLRIRMAIIAQRQSRWSRTLNIVKYLAALPLLLGTAVPWMILLGYLKILIWVDLPHIPDTIGILIGSLGLFLPLAVPLILSVTLSRWTSHPSTLRLRHKHPLDFSLIETALAGSLLIVPAIVCSTAVLFYGLAWVTAPNPEPWHEVQHLNRILSVQAFDCWKDSDGLKVSLVLYNPYRDVAFLPPFGIGWVKVENKEQQFSLMPSDAKSRFIKIDPHASAVIDFTAHFREGWDIVRAEFEAKEEHNNTSYMCGVSAGDFPFYSWHADAGFRADRGPASWIYNRN